MLGKDKSLVEVVVIEPNKERLQALTRGLQDLGFSRVKPAKSLAATLESVECGSRAPDWIITPLLPDERINALSWLALGLRHRCLRHTLISLVYDSEDAPVVADAFQMGLWSCHARLADLDLQLAELGKATTLQLQADGEDSLVAAHFLRAFLRGQALHLDLLRLESNLVALYPAKKGLVVKLAQALHLDGRSNDALTALHRIGEADEEVQVAARRAGEKIRADLAVSGDPSETFAKRNGIVRMMIVDPDATVRKHVSDIALALGVAEIQEFDDGQAAWEYLESGTKVDLIISEWRLPKLSGKALLNRVRGHLVPSAPVFIYSALVKEEADKALVRDMGVLEVIQKPMTEEQLAETLRSLIELERGSTDVKNRERRIREAIDGGKFAEARSLMDAAGTELPKHAESALLAEMAYGNGDYEVASQHAVQALALGGERLQVIDLLGRIYMKLRMFVQAEAFFEKARRFSPENVQRLCLLAEVRAEAGDAKGAQQVIGKAKAIDALDVRVREAEVNVALTVGDTDTATATLAGLPDISGVVRFMNNRAVALAARDSFSESIALYQKALASLPAAQKQYRAIIQYNMALALIKNGNQKGAASRLKDAASVDKSPVQGKSASLLRRLNRALKSGKTVSLRSQANPDAQDPSEQVIQGDAPALPIALGIPRGQLRCHLVFQSARGPADLTLDLLQQFPDFAPSQESIPAVVVAVVGGARPPSLKVTEVEGDEARMNDAAEEPADEAFAEEELDSSAPTSSGPRSKKAG